MLTVQQIHDPSPVWNEIKPYMIDDSQFLPRDGNFIGVFDDDDFAGAFMVIPWSEYCFEVHGGVAKRFWGRGPEICRAFGESLFRDTQCVKIVACVPSFNRLMIKCLRELGLAHEGTITKSFFKNMKFHDQLIFGISRGDVIKWQQQ